MAVPIPTPVFRILHTSNLRVYLHHGILHAPRHLPAHGPAWTANHDLEVQSKRANTLVPCGPRGCLLDYVAFYFGPRSPMLYRLHTGYQIEYRGGQGPIIYLVSSAQAIEASGARFVFSDGHGIAKFTDWYDNLAQLDLVDWEAVYAQWWKDTDEDIDRQRRKQAEFLVHQILDWSLIQEIGVHDLERANEVEGILGEYGHRYRPPVRVHPEWYY